jgi:hypothetical protein
MPFTTGYKWLDIEMDTNSCEVAEISYYLLTERSSEIIQWAGKCIKKL